MRCTTADDALSETTRHEEILTWDDGFLEDLGCPKPSPDDFRWITAYAMVQRVWSPINAGDLIRFVSSLALRADTERDVEISELLAKYRVSDFEMDDGLDPDRPGSSRNSGGKPSLRFIK